MSKVFFRVTMSLDGFLAPEWRSDEQWMGQWSQLQSHVFKQKFFRDNLKLGGGGETGADNRILEETFHRTGTTILGKRMFDAGERMWPEEAPFHTPVFVVTHQKRDPWVRKGGTTFHFVNDGIESALRQAREVVGDKDIRIGGGATLLKQYLNAGLVDEFHIALAPVLLHEGIRLFDRIDANKLSLSIIETPHSPHVTHLRYAVKAS
jgi:dihydrofolate reductase